MWRKRLVLSRLRTLGIALPAAALIAFHLALLWRRLADASIAQPGVLARWLGAVLLIAGILTVRRHLRHAFVVFWLLVVILHAGMPVDDQVLDRSGQIAVVVQVGFAAASAVLLSLGLAATADDRRLDAAPLEIRATLAAQDRNRGTRSGRSPPTL